MAGIAGAGCEPDGAAAQQLILPPQWQPWRTGWLAHAGAVAASNCAHASSKLNKMADNGFTNFPARTAAGSNHFFAAAASWIFFR